MMSESGGLRVRDGLRPESQFGILRYYSLAINVGDISETRLGVAIYE